MKAPYTLAASALLLALTYQTVIARNAQAALKDVDGKPVGSAALTQTPAGVLIRLSVKGLPAGEHAFHIHEVGKCEPPFASAGGHFNPGNKKQGLMTADGLMRVTCQICIFRPLASSSSRS